MSIFESLLTTCEAIVIFGAAEVVSKVDLIESKPKPP